MKPRRLVGAASQRSEAGQRAAAAAALWISRQGRQPDTIQGRENENLVVAGQIVAEAHRRRLELIGQSSGRRGDGEGSRQSADRVRWMAMQQPIAGRGGFKASLFEG